jgi:lipopolysaccharide export system permease protein
MEFGQKFGYLLIFVESVSQKNLNNIVLYNPIEEHIVKATTGEIINGSFVANNGIAYKLQSGDKLSMIEFSKATINRDTIDSNIKNLSIIDYWSEIDNNKSRMKDFILAIFISMLPFVVIFWSAIIGIFNPRYQKNRSYYLIALFILYYLISFIIATSMPLLIIIILPAIFLSGIFYFNRIRF